ncbi:heparinase II/III family protein [Lentibacter algarum]|uniref:heparinase II/III family protein n=1 Tax=Lentibacter algarum TaxID=576131 RepID=UPI002091945F|nr:heparinase II/III family protein [Lentibacter algarum]
MSEQEPIGAFVTRLINRYHARVGAFSTPPTAFVSQPEPRSIGLFARGKQLIAGNYLLAGQLLTGARKEFWDLPLASPEYQREAQGFGWLDDLAAVGDSSARLCAQTWLLQWNDKFGRGTGPGWTPDLTGRRLIRWISHAFFLMQNLESEQSHQFFRSLAHQTNFLGKRWQASLPGLARFEALTGLIYASLSLEGMERHIAPAQKALARECATQIDAMGGLSTRNPEELLEVFTLLSWVALALREAGHPVTAEHEAALARIAPTLRSLRHADGSLARFHGGGKGVEGRLEHALAASGVKPTTPDGLSMGFARLSAGRTTIIIDASLPPTGRASHNAHASTLAFELTSGRRPLIVNCGSGACFGAEWRRAGRATPSHSTLCIDGSSSAHLTPAARDGAELITGGPTHVPVEISHVTDGLRFQGGHDGWVKTRGLTHARTLEITSDGRGIVGEDLLIAIDEADKATFIKSTQHLLEPGLLFHIRFHLHPEVDSAVDLGGAAVSMALRSGEIWVLRAGEGSTLSLEPSVYLETGRLKPRASKQVVLTARAFGPSTRLLWSLSKAQESAIGIRDVQQDDIEPH